MSAPIQGPRGTTSLAPDQVPSGLSSGRRKRKRRGRTQPYRRHHRVPGPTLTAMLRGRPAYLPNPMDLRRQAQKRRGR